MNRILFVRTVVFKSNQADFATLCGVGQATISRWEKGEGGPTLETLRVIRATAAQRGIAWDHEWLFGNHPASITGEQHRCSEVASHG